MVNKFAEHFVSVFSNSENKKINNLWFNLIAISFAMIIVGLAIIYYIDNIKEKSLALPAIKNETSKIIKSIGGRNLQIPSSLFKYSVTKDKPFVEKIELIFILPLTNSPDKNKIHVSLQPQRMTKTSAELLDAVYLHKFLPNELRGPKGLIGKPLKNIVGYRGEVIWYDPISKNPFVAKCMQAITDKSTQKCIRTIRLNKYISATYIFDFEILYAWKEFDKEVQKWLEKIDGI